MFKKKTKQDMCRFVRIGSSDCLFYTCLKHTLFGEYHSALTKRKKTVMVSNSTYIKTTH